MQFDRSNELDNYMLLWARKFATAKIECSFEKGNKTPLGGNINFAGDGTFSFISCTIFLFAKLRRTAWQIY